MMLRFGTPAAIQRGDHLAQQGDRGHRGRGARGVDLDRDDVGRRDEARPGVRGILVAGQRGHALGEHGAHRRLVDASIPDRLRMKDLDHAAGKQAGHRQR